MSKKQSPIQLVLTIGVPLLSMFAVVQMFRTADLDRVEGITSKIDARCRDLREVIGDSLGRGEMLVLEEAEINAYLTKTLFGRQRGATRFVSSFQGACVDLRDGEIEFILRRKVFGRPFNVTCSFVIREKDGQRMIRSVGSSVGRLRIPYVVLETVLGSFRNLGQALEQEGEYVQKMDAIIFRDGELMLVPPPE